MVQQTEAEKQFYLEGGLIESYDDRDFRLSSELIDLSTVKNPYKRVVRTNQAITHEHRSSCAIFGLMSSVAYNTGIPINHTIVEKASSQAIDEGVVDLDRGATFISAVKFVKKFIKQEFDVPLKFYRIGLEEDQYTEITKEWSIGVAYRTSLGLSQDIQEDGIVDRMKYEKHGGHLVHTYNDEIKTIKTGIHQYYHNSYQGVLTYNEFYVKFLKDLVRHNVFFQYGYILVREELITEIDQLQVDIAHIEQLYNDGITNNYQNVVDIRNGNYTTDIRALLFDIRMHEKYLQKDS